MSLIEAGVAAEQAKRDAAAAQAQAVAAAAAAQARAVVAATAAKKEAEAAAARKATEAQWIQTSQAIKPIVDLTAPGLRWSDIAFKLVDKVQEQHDKLTEYVGTHERAWELLKEHKGQGLKLDEAVGKLLAEHDRAEVVLLPE